MPKAKKTTKKEIKKTGKAKASVKRAQKSDVLDFSGVALNLNKTKEKVITSLKTNPRARVIFGVIIVLALLIILVPHLIVAMVDGKPITVFSYYHQLDQKYGNDTKQQLISEQLVEDEALKRGV